MNDILNPKIFDSKGKMIKSVRLAILDIVDEFIDQVDESVDLPILDVILVGSNANYNYTDKSDLDIHIVTNFNDISDDNNLAGLFTNDERKIFNSKYDISIKGISAEVYVEDVNGASTTSNGIYSVLNDSWIKVPVREDLPEFNIEDTGYNELPRQADRLLNDSDVSSSEIQEFIDALYLMRKYSIMSDGEYGEGNLAFKELRSRGILDDLKDKLEEVRSKELSLESMKIEVTD